MSNHKILNPQTIGSKDEIIFELKQTLELQKANREKNEQLKMESETLVIEISGLDGQKIEHKTNIRNQLQQIHQMDKN
jgi:RNase P/RNase MRP subunit p29